jgi:cysteine synthase A
LDPTWSILNTIGDTPLVELQHLPIPGTGRVFAKCEQMNPGGSVKDRIAKSMVEKAEQEGLLGPNFTLVEPTSGNTGIGLAMVAAVKGYRCILTMPDDMSEERRATLRAFGAELVLTPAQEGMGGAVEAALQICEGRDNAFMPMQFDNPANPDIHETTTGPEILKAFEGQKIDALVCGVGTGGTITGVSRFLKRHFPHMRVIAVEPERSPVLAGGQPDIHRIQGIGAGFVPRVLDRSLLDEIIHVTDEAALRTRELLGRREGLNVGISAGANVYAALEVAEQLTETQNVVTVLCDTGDRYTMER